MISGSYGLGVYSFVTFGFYTSNSKSKENRVFCCFSLLGLGASCAMFLTMGFLINGLLEYDQFITFIDILLELKALPAETPTAMDTFLVLYFFFLVIKSPLHLMLAKRVFFELFIECRFKAISDWDPLFDQRRPLLQETRTPGRFRTGGGPTHSEIERIHRHNKSPNFFEDKYANSYFWVSLITLVGVSAVGAAIAVTPTGTIVLSVGSAHSDLLVNKRCWNELPGVHRALSPPHYSVGHLRSTMARPPDNLACPDPWHLLMYLVAFEHYRHARLLINL